MRSPYTATKSSPCLLQLEKAQAKQQTPSTAKKKIFFRKCEKQTLLSPSLQYFHSSPNGLKHKLENSPKMKFMKAIRMKKLDYE